MAISFILWKEDIFRTIVIVLLGIRTRLMRVSSISFQHIKMKQISTDERDRENGKDELQIIDLSLKLKNSHYICHVWNVKLDKWYGYGVSDL